jgi:transposase
MVTLNLKEEKRLELLNEIERRRITGRQGAQILQVSVRHFRRLVAAYRNKGASTLQHGNRGRKPAHALDIQIRDQVLLLAKTKYMGFNVQHLTESLAERDGIKLSRSTVRRILLCHGINSPRRRRAPKHRSRRPRWSQEGLLLQIDASHHDWLEGRGPKMALLGAIDDATGKVVNAFFREQEDSEGYFNLLKNITTAFGLPHALYHDGHSIFEPNQTEGETIEEQLEGKKHHTQFGRLLDELFITSIRSRSPQARGRIERLWGTFQDRLVSELRLANASTMEEANIVLQAYIPNHNRKFAVPAQVPGSAFREAPAKKDEYFCFKYNRTVSNDNVVRIGPHRLQVLPSHGRSSYAHNRIEVRQSFDGALSLFFQDRRLETAPAECEATVLRKPQISYLKPREYRKPAADHPWRAKFITHVDRG